MKKQTLLTTTLSLLVITLVAPLALQAQGGSSQNIRLIDMGLIFQKYQKFTDMRESLKAKMEQTDQKGKVMADQIKAIQTKLKSGALKVDSPEFIRNQERLVELTSSFKGFRENLQREFLRKEAKVYQQIYLEIADAVATGAKYEHYSLVLRFNRNGVDTAMASREILQKMNRSVIYYNKDIDITDDILKFLNKRYNRTAGTSRKTTRQ